MANRGAYADIDALTSPWATLIEVAVWRTRLNRAPGESIEQEIRHLRRVRSSLPASVEGEARVAVLAAMDALTDSLEYRQRQPDRFTE